MAWLLVSSASQEDQVIKLWLSLFAGYLEWKFPCKTSSAMGLVSLLVLKSVVASQICSRDYLMHGIYTWVQFISYLSSIAPRITGYTTKNSKGYSLTACHRRILYRLDKIEWVRKIVNSGYYQCPALQINDFHMRAPLHIKFDAYCAHVCSYVMHHSY